MGGFLGTYLSFLLVLGASALTGQAIFAAAGRRTWSRLAPAVGLAALLAISWATVRLPGRGTTALVVLGAVAALAALYLRGRLTDARRAARIGVPVELCALAAASLPFLIEMRFGILGTGLNPDMSQHLFAADRLADGVAERLVSEGYPLGPHALVVALSSLGPSLVQSFDGLAIAAAVATCVAALGLLEQLAPWRRIAGALVVGFAYLLASNYVQGAFKESLEALFVLAFAIGLAELARGGGAEPPGPLRALPLAVLAVGTLYAYSFPGLLWIGGALGAWVVLELLARGGGLGAARSRLRAAAPAAAVGFAFVVAAALPEVGRIADFASFETFDPSSAGLGNLFDRLSPLEALGIWPSGDFRVEPGDGAVPAIVFYLGAALGAAALAWGLRVSLRRGDRALPAALAAAVVLWLYALAAGTPYQEAKALVIAAPVVAAISVRGLLADGPAPAALAFLAAAGGSSLLALVNGPVGPAGYSAELAAYRAALPAGSVLVLAPEELLDEQHGRDWIGWELRGNRICVEAEGSGELSGEALSALLKVKVDGDGAVVPDGIVAVDSPRPSNGVGPCPLIADGARADPAGDD